MEKNSSRFEVYQDAKRHWRWNLIGGDRSFLAKSPNGYGSKQACIDELVAVKRLVGDADVVEAV